MDVTGRLRSVLVGGVRLEAVGPLAPDEVWRRYTRPGEWPSWAPHLRAVEHEGDVIRPGSTGRVTGVAGAVAHFRVDAVDEATRTWSWSVRSGPLRLSFDHGVDPAPLDSVAPGGSRAWLVAHGPRPVVLAYAPLARWSLGRLVSPG